MGAVEMMAPIPLEDPMRKILIAAAIIMLMSSTAQALDFTKRLTNLDGSPVTDTEGKPLAKPPTLGSICESALLSQFADERDATGKETIEAREKYERWKLAAKINAATKDLALTAEELALVKKLVGKAYGPLIVGQVWTMLDPGVK